MTRLRRVALGLQLTRRSTCQILSWQPTRRHVAASNSAPSYFGDVMGDYRQPCGATEEPALARYAVAEGFCEGVIPAVTACTVRDLYVIWTPEPPASAKLGRLAATSDDLRRATHL